MIADIILISASIINIFAIAILVVERKINIAIGLSIIQAIAWLFRFLGYY